MVTPGARRRRGASTLGCVVSLLLFAGALYYGVRIGEVYLRYYRLLDVMRFQASLARSNRDEDIARRLTATADSILGQTPVFRLKRAPRRITIQTEYSERVELPFYKHTFVLRPRVDAPL